MTAVWTFLIYAVIQFVVMYILVEYGQKYLHDEVTPHALLKVTAGALISAAVLTFTHPSLDTMFTSKIHLTLLLAIVLMAIFVLIFQFQPLHGAGFGLAFVLLIPGISTMVVDGAQKSAPQVSNIQSTTANKGAVRKGVSGGALPAPKPETEKK